MTTHGQRANKSGRILEGVVRSALEGPTAFGFVVFTNEAYSKLVKQGSPVPERFLVKNRPYDTIYRTRGKTEFLLGCTNVSSTPAFPVSGKFLCRIECKYQASAGSVDEKFPYLYLSCLEAMPETNVIILLEASGARRQAVQWLRDAVAQHKYDPDKKKNIRIMSVTEFIAWSNDAFGAYTPA